MNTRGNGGFTLLELMTTLLVASILLGLGVPNLLQFVRNNRMAAATNDFVGAVHLARNEAVSRRAPITLCTSPNPVAANPTCSPDASGTNGGYVVWVDEDSDTVVDAEEDVLFQAGEADGISLLANNGYVHFDRDGFIDSVPAEGAPASLILFCDSRGNVRVAGGTSAARAVRIPPTGRPTLLVSVDDITATGAACP